MKTKIAILLLALAAFAYWWYRDNHSPEGRQRAAESAQIAECREAMRTKSDVNQSMQASRCRRMAEAYMQKWRREP